MSNSIRIGIRVSHYKYGKGVVERLIPPGLAEVRFGKTVKYVIQTNLTSLDQKEGEKDASVVSLE